ncbi:MAG: putative Histidine kinase [Schlesneria sp.]|nr:putative Histidine kinase [Schlesneria sp.]
MTPCDPQSPLDLLKRAVGTAIHDINNLLLVISCSSSKLLEQIPATDLGRDAAVSIGEATERIAEITAQLQMHLAGPQSAGEPQPHLAGEVTQKGTEETVLIVDDDPQVRQFIKTALIRGGYHVLEARHGPAAIALALRHRGLINLLVTDMLMPEMTGRELADALRTDVPSLRVLYLSGLDGSADLSTQPSALDAFVQKPFRMPELLLKIREILDK